MHPNDEVLVAIALGDEVAQGDAEHVRGCAECGATVTELAGLIARVPAAGDIDLVEPPAEVWTRIAAEVAQQPGEVSSVAQPDLPAAADGRWSRRAWLLGAAAAGVAVGVAGAQLLPRLAQPQPTVLMRTSLDTLDTQQPGGQATLIAQGQSLQLALNVTPLDPGGGFLEVWLINIDLKRMVSIGVLPAGVTQQGFAVSGDLVDAGYRIVDISRELLDDRPEHSGDSLLRGTLV
ncbi:MAG: anti-sigma factor [Micropruina sp.]|nr:anti-sigma factor [Micropruina sp.]